jgi:hypothetical protein
LKPEDVFGPNEGTLAGTADWATGIGGGSGKGLLLDGAGHVNVGAVPAIDFTSGVGTVEGWIRADWTNAPAYWPCMWADRDGGPTVWSLHLSSDKISDYVLTVAVADMFDALVSDRPYRRAFNNQEALSIIEKDKNKKLSSQFVDILYQHVNIYSLGMVVTLNTGDIAIVTKENNKDKKNPQVKLLFSDGLKFYDGDYKLDLAADNKVFISNVQSAGNAEKYISLYLSLKYDKLQHHTDNNKI